MKGPVIVGKIELPEPTINKSDETVLIIRDMRTQEQIENSNSEEEYYALLEERQMFHWLQLGINKEITDRYFNEEIPYRSW